MIEELTIRDLGVIGEARLPLGPGFTAITGETGAGKTMVVTALGLLLGERADSADIRSGSGGALVEGHWLIDPAGAVAGRVLDAGGELDSPDGSGRVPLVLGRSVSAEGRSRAVVGGRSTPVGVLNEIGQQLVVVHGQSDQTRLRSSSAQREALDRFAGPELAQLLAAYQEAYRRWEDNRRQLQVLISEFERRVREADELRLIMSEIDSVAPRPGEDAELAELAERLTNLENLRAAAAQAHELISAQSADGELDALARLDTARRQLERVALHDSALEPIVEGIAEAMYLMSDIAVQLSGYLAALDDDGGRELEAVQERRAELTALTRRYGPSLDEVIGRLEAAGERLLQLDNDSDRLRRLEVQTELDRSEVAGLAGRLSRLRRLNAARLSESVTAELAALAMPEACIVVEVQDRDEFSVTGRDQVSILLQPHPGAEPRPIGRGASGGELSRIMLAIEVVIAGSDPVPTFVFDEVDAGIGGATAIEVGRRLATLARSAQVIVVTHLAQVAAFSTNHLRVVKSADSTMTMSSVHQLHGQERVAEMARLLSGLPDSESGLAHARELLEMAGPAALRAKLQRADKL